ncbi:creatininase family protein [Dongia rigui]|uniref:Creatininase family protein n=1 Tax=Dongia rigui TaxID=940149 RepID=A0ABU5E1V7_9PROT|nr:creatininase family protein [Dongia rigui]MDY0873463.1 creatininase family protein [Dongia rigui]
MTFARNAVLLLLLSAALPASAQSAAPVELEQLTSPEVAALQQHGWDTIIIPTGGTEQNGPQLTLGKHNIIMRYTAGEIAKRLGHTLVAPILAYVPEGNIDPPEGHMQSPGTISLPEPVFAAVVEAAARSFIATGFKTVLLIGDSGPNQAPQEAVAAKLGAEFATAGIHVIAVTDYYAANGQVDWLRAAGQTEADIGVHAGIRETSELLAIDPSAVRRELLTAATTWPEMAGRPDHAKAEWGRRLLDLKIEAALRQIRRLRGQSE